MEEVLVGIARRRRASRTIGERDRSVVVFSCIVKRLLPLSRRLCYRNFSHDRFYRPRATKSASAAA
jgi:hypothetical protein